MKKSFASCIALAVLASLALPAAAAPKRAPVSGNDTPYRQGVAVPANTVVSEGRVIGVDPDPNIRTQLFHDPDPSGF